MPSGYLLVEVSSPPRCWWVNTLYNVAQWVRYSGGGCYDLVPLRWDSATRTLLRLTKVENGIIEGIIQTHDSLEMTPVEHLPEWVEPKEVERLKQIEEDWWWQSEGGKK